MRLNIRDLKPAVTVTISGDEAWLARIYEDFPLTDRGTNRIRGSVVAKLHPDAGAVSVRGNVRFEPAVPCSRCSKSIPWRLEAEIDVWVLPPVTQEAEDHLLSADELDAYYLENDTVDLETIVNDALQTELPSRLIVETEAGDACGVCGDDLGEERLWSSATREETSPFAKLRQIQTKKS